MSLLALCFSNITNPEEGAKQIQVDQLWMKNRIVVRHKILPLFLISQPLFTNFPLFFQELYWDLHKHETLLRFNNNINLLSGVSRRQTDGLRGCMRSNIGGGGAGMMKMMSYWCLFQCRFNVLLTSCWCPTSVFDGTLRHCWQLWFLIKAGIIFLLEGKRQL